MNNMNPEAGTEVRALGWGAEAQRRQPAQFTSNQRANGMAEAYTGNHAGHRAVRTRLKVDTAP